MKWRCTWCGKPHAENDPPCDSCGHNTFEEAVVRQDEAVQSDQSTIQTVDTGTTYIWVCSNCGRQHVKNNPPCARCGEHDLEKTEQNYDELENELQTPSWFEVAKPYLPVFAIIGIVLLLFGTGIISPSIIPGIGSPTPPEAPGNSTEAAGIDLDAVESQVVDQLAVERADGSPTTDDALMAYATYHNRVYIEDEYGDGSHSAEHPNEFDVSCQTDLVSTPLSPFEDDINDYADAGEEQLVADVTEVLVELESVTEEYDVASDGFDLHVAPDGTIYVFYAAC
ncbi:uncharacterized protein Nmag_3576 [Natrialba magadii ATCC 43099]|uniref:Uncharacterized protein n=1 Tax=Natrialba magadii (strain ATCC 43099 / DSM 3394 / CCM 3739 / CIP 104546 / IAM 13178 / JCM 8861 / NBRC 102185 / NCIMB 2190 / MS3) TaxID=547559 RepID=D3SU37_NATMM|nr:hypothetical protein [Natrialba magadii]ADD07126.1 uncharacterized protein Nmag_3576 [Natrialba magadii ATCC 43099]ELY29098.1 hypothetical protein C500_12335 [Natrialba magadii ATCC 43099]